MTDAISPSPPFIRADYRKEVIDEYRGNPLIEALPPIRSQEDWMNQLLIPPPFDKSMIHLPGHLRSHLVMRLNNFFLPLARHIEVAQRIDTVLRSGYVNRNPHDKTRITGLQRLYESGQQDSRQQQHFSEHRPIASLSLMGFSGVGKSTSVEHCLRSFLQVIWHEDIGLHQIVWLKVDCPMDGSIKQLLFDIIGQIDRLLGTTFRKGLSSRVGVDELLDTVKHLALVYQLGLLIVDEIQNLNVKKSGGKETMLNFFQELCNQLGVPVMLLGTMKAKAILQLDFRHARRTTGLGSFVWEAMPYDEEWEFLVEYLWGYQWVKLPVAFRKAIAKVLHNETQGIVAILCSGFMVCQMQAIRTGVETVTAELFEKVMKKDFQPVQPMLNALRSGDPRRIGNYQDICSMNFDYLLHREQLAAIATSAPKVAATPVPPAHPDVHLAAASIELMGFERSMATQTLMELSQTMGKCSVSMLVQAFLKRQAAQSSEDDHLAAEDPEDLRKK